MLWNMFLFVFSYRNKTDSLNLTLINTLMLIVTYCSSGPCVGICPVNPKKKKKLK